MDSIMTTTSDSPNANSNSEQEIENFIGDWYWDDQSHKFAQDLCRFLFQFIDHLTESGLTKKTVRKHLDNCWAIGVFECQYGYRETFSVSEVFFSPEASYEYEFKRKMSDSSYAVNSYLATWKKVYKYAKALGLTD